MRIAYQTRTAATVAADSDTDNYFSTRIYRLYGGQFFLVIRFHSAVDEKYDFFLNGGQLFDTLGKAKDAATVQITDFLTVPTAP